MLLIKKACIFNAGKLNSYVLSFSIRAHGRENQTLQKSLPVKHQTLHNYQRHMPIEIASSVMHNSLSGSHIVASANYYRKN